MANAYLDLIWRGQSVTAGTAKAKAELVGLGAAAAQVGSGIGAAVGSLGGIFGVGGGLAAQLIAVAGTLREGVRGTEAWEVAAQATGDTLQNMGIRGEGALARVEAAVGRVVEATAFGDDQLLSAANSLIEGTQDLEGSLRNLSLVADLATSKTMDLASAAAIVAKVMEGNNRAVGQMLPFLRTYAESLEGIVDPAERAEKMLTKLSEAVSGKAANQLKTGAGVWAELKDSFGELAEGFVELTRLNDLWNQSLIGTTNILKTLTPGSKEMAAFWKDFVHNMNVDRSKPSEWFQVQHAPPDRPSSAPAGPGWALDALLQPPAAIQGPGNAEGAAKFAAVVDDWKRAVDKWAFAIDPKFSDPRLPGGKYGSVEQRGEVRPLRLRGEDQRVRELDEDLLDPARKRMREIAQYAETSLASAIVAGGNAGWGGFLSSLKQTGLSALADLVAGAFANFILPGSSTGGILGPILGAFGLSGARADNLAARGAR